MNLRKYAEDGIALLKKSSDPENVNKQVDGNPISHTFHDTAYVEDFPGMLEQFSIQMRNAAEEFATDATAGSTRLIAPYIAVVQSSGVGKSRLLYEFAKRHLSMFMCVRDDRMQCC